jgi:tellurite resistance protein TerC
MPEFLAAPFMGTPFWMWAIFFVLVPAILAFDLGVLSKGAREIGARQATRLAAVYISAGLLFSLVIAWERNWSDAFTYLTAYVVEQSLALDNLFVIAVIFAQLGVPRHLQHRALVWGIIGVVVLRGVLILAGSVLIEQYSWLLTVFAVILLYTGIKMLRSGDVEYDTESSPILKLIKRWIPVTDGLREDAFFVREANPAGKVVLMATPLFVALVLVEIADVMFAFDSIPAVFAITTDAYLVFTSNIFAILGLRAIYFALAAALQQFEYLKYALAGVLVFIGGKILAHDIFGLPHISSGWSLAITLTILAAGFIASFLHGRRIEPSSLDRTPE